ncbi:MAG: Rrf2 family transcriptional regulator [Kiritimatiellae bacterium]|nr:Rrf2 family transcriptional regulator [Kiritimatiellia bacterium]
MKITAQARYALRILLDIATHGGAEPRSIKEIAASQGISEKFISRIAVPLRRAGLVATERGAKGGLRLAKRPENVTLLAIVEAMDGPLALVPCLARPGACARQGACAAERAWGKANGALAAALRETTLEDVAEDERRMEREGDGGAEYCI